MSELTPLPPGIVLCTHCGARLSKPGSLPRGASPVCTDCAEERASTRRLRAVKALEWVSIDESPRPDLRPPAPRRRKLAPIAICGALVVVLAFGGWLLRPGRSRAPGAPAREPTAAVGPASEPAEDPAIRKAVQAKKEAEETRVRRQSELRQELSALDQETSALEAKEEFSRVLEILARAQDRHEDALWVEGVGERDGAVLAKVEAQFAAIRDVASETTDPGEKAKLRDRVTRWGLRAPLEDLEKLWAVAPPPAPPVRRSKEAVRYEEEWETAIAPSVGRDYDRSLGALRQAAKGLQEEEVRRVAAADLNDLEKVKLLYLELLKLIPGWPRGRAMTLEVGGARISGAFVQGDGDRVELRVTGERETTFVEVAEASSSSLAALAGDRLDPRTLALFCLIEGHLEAAKSHLKTLDEVPERYWSWAKVARSRAPKLEIDEEARRRDRNARDLYVAAEREYRSMVTRPMAVQRYRSLVKDYSETDLVRRAMGRISRRTEGCSDYFLTAAEAVWGGTFRKGERPGIGACVVSQADSDFTRAQDNFVEFEFGVMERESYRCWAQVGACCQESFQAFYQTTDLVVTHPRRPKERVAAEPGSIFAITIATPPAVLPALHSIHGGPKEPTIWGWIELPLPRFPTPGAKRLRLVTAQQGFAVARILVSTTRTERPRESDLKALLEGREPELRTLPPPLGEPGLVGWWTFDEGAGDLSGNGHDATVPLDSSWEPGRVGRALSLKGGSGATVPDSSALRVSGDLTIVFWVRPVLGSGERTLLVGKGENYGVWIVPGGRVLFEQLDAVGRPVLSVSPAKALETGRWTHVAAIVRGGHGSVYLDGTAEAARVRTGIPSLSEAPLVFGAAFTGLLDEVRIFSKALASDELARQAGR